MSLTQYRSFIIKHLQMKIDDAPDDEEQNIGDIVDHVLEALQMKISELPAPKSPSKRRSGYTILSNLLNSEQSDDVLELIDKVGPVEVRPDRDYAPKTVNKVKTIDPSVFDTYPSLNHAYTAAKSQSLAGFALTAFVWANLEPSQKEHINNFAIGNQVKSPLLKQKNVKSARKGGHNAIKTVVGHAITKSNDHVLRLLENDEFHGKEKGREVGQQLWKQIKNNTTLTDKWHSINNKLPKGQTERKNTVDSDPDFFELLEETIHFVLA